VPTLVDLFSPTTVLDLGCAEGAWLEVFQAAGSSVTGVDGDYVDRRRLLLPEASFVSHDLSLPLDLGRRFDLALCLETAEHLPPDAADVIVGTLTRHSDLIIFSAAIPGQGGTSHLNEQWPSYWVARFADAGYEVFDVLRGRLWWQQDIAHHFRQNMLVFARGERARQVAELPKASMLMDVVHPDQFALVGIRLALRKLRESVVFHLNRLRRAHS